MSNCGTIKTENLKIYIKSQNLKTSILSENLKISIETECYYFEQANGIGQMAIESTFIVR